MNLIQLRELRQRLAARLKSLIRNPAIEEKELAAFDLVMSRREFLKASELATVSALVMAGVPPTVWAKAAKDPNLKVCPQDVGLTDGDQAMVGVATQLLVGTELFQDSIYAQPVVAQNLVGSHAVIEGPRGRLRLQSDLQSADPAELGFLDPGYHYGPMELIQLEGDDTNGWELVHYHHPWGPRTDGARTDGVVRQVIMTKNSGLKHPTRVIAVGAYYNNQIAGASEVTYAVFVEDTATGFPGHLAVGVGIIDLMPPYSAEPAYPLKWVSQLLDATVLGDATGYVSADKYTNGPYQDPSTFNQVLATGHIVLYAQNVIKLIAIGLPNQNGGPVVMLSTLAYPSGAPGARVLHIDWNPLTFKSFGGGQGGDYIPENIVLVSSTHDSSGDQDYNLYSINYQNNVTHGSQLTIRPPAVLIDQVNWNPAGWVSSSLHIPAAQIPNGDVLDYSAMRDVQSLYYLAIPAGGGGTAYFHVKLANFGDSLVGLVVQGNGAPNAASVYSLQGQFPLAFPDANGLGKVLAFSGGVSKFGGFRFVASDADGNMFLLRQRRLPASDSPYPAPIYGPFDAQGAPLKTLSSSRDPIPSNTASDSNLPNLGNWVAASSAGGQNATYAYNLLLNLALAFGTTDTNARQGVWLGNVYLAAYAPDRFGADVGFIAIKPAQTNGGADSSYNAYHVIQNQADKTWRQRLIASQIIPQGPGLQETGDHYQATVTPANVYGKPVSLLVSGNQNLLIEVRADSPCTVIDDTNNLYYDVDRYTSFMSPPDPASGRLCLLVKADVFSQVLYVRLVDGSALQPSSDAAMLSSTAETVYPWQSANLALQAQQRMGNGAPPSSLLGDDMPLADTTVYVSSDTLAASNQSNPWQTKGNYQPTSSNLGSVADYLNSSGQNLISATGQLSLGAPNANNAIDPLYAVTAVPSDPQRDTVTTAFGYAAGTVATTRSAPSLVLSRAPLGSVWGSISHALHDALHWLQNVEGEVYNDLGSGAVTLVSAVDGITAKVSKEIMKQVNGVEQELDEVVSTVEEYASVVANVILTIVEQSFIVKYFELLIALISLFLHFENMLALSKSLRSFFDDLFTGGGSVSLPQVPTSFSSQMVVDQYLGLNNVGSSALQNVDTSNVISELVNTIADGVLENPLVKKILNKALSLIGAVLNEVNPPLPFDFQMNTDSQEVQDTITQIDNFAIDAVKAVAGVTADAITQLLDDVVGDLADPQAAYQDLGMQLTGLFEGVATDTLGDIFNFVDGIGRQGPTLAHDLISDDPYLVINTTALADLCKLFGIGSVVGNQLKVSLAEAVFLPLAVIMWVTVYMQEGKSMKSVDDLTESLSVAPPGQLGSADTTIWNYARVATNAVLQELIGLAWFVSVNESEFNEFDSTKAPWKQFLQVSRLFGITRWLHEFAFATYKLSQSVPTSTQIFDYVVISVRLFMAGADAALNVAKANNRDGWPAAPNPSDITQMINSFLQVAWMGVDTVEGYKQGTNGFTLVGNDLFRSQILFMFMYNILREPLTPYFESVTLAVLGMPIAGVDCQIDGLLGVVAAPPGTGGPGNGRGCGRGRPTNHTPGSGRGPSRGHGKGPKSGRD